MEKPEKEFRILLLLINSHKRNQCILKSVSTLWGTDQGLRRQGSNLRPIAYVFSIITDGTDYIISISCVYVPLGRGAS